MGRLEDIMQVTYVIRHFNQMGGVLRMRVVPCADDGEAIHQASIEPFPSGCASVEVAREDKLIWRRETGDSGTTRGGAAMRPEVKTAA
jgi:hypothetical protein